MSGNKIGVIVDSFRVGVREGLRRARAIGADCVQIYAVDGEMDPAGLTAAARAELRAYIASLELEISALCGDLGGHGFQDRATNAAKIDERGVPAGRSRRQDRRLVRQDQARTGTDGDGDVRTWLRTACADDPDSRRLVRIGPDSSRELTAELQVKKGG